MKNLRRTFTVLFAAAFSMQVLAQREDKLINQDWSFRFSHQVNASAARRVDLPHTWNAQDALGGKHDYKRGIGNYTKKIFIRPEWQGKRLFLRFEGANCVSNVFVNGKHIGEHYPLPPSPDDGIHHAAASIFHSRKNLYRDP
jgi:beta-galactosidase